MSEEKVDQYESAVCNNENCRVEDFLYGEDGSCPACGSKTSWHSGL